MPTDLGAPGSLDPFGGLVGEGRQVLFVLLSLPLVEEKKVMGSSFGGLRTISFAVFSGER